ncbi:alpha/beta hydrolase family protein [Flindersiella endophytica]
MRLVGISLAAVGLLAGILGAAAPATAAPADDEVSFAGSGGVRLHGSILVPPGSVSARRPGLVMVGGATNAAHGPKHTRDDLRAEAEEYARRGIVTLIYDKRTVGYSMFHRDYAVLGDDALAALRVLRARPDVDPDRIGLWGRSEGAWAVSLAAAESDAVKYVITVGAAGLTPARQTAWSNEQYLRHAGVSGSLVSAAGKALRLAVATRLFPEAHYNPVPAWRHVHQPVLLLWGSRDRVAAPEESSAIIRRALEQGGNTHDTIRFLPGDHDIHVTHDNGFDHDPTPTPGASDVVAAWVADLADDPPATNTQPAPRQASTSHPLAPLNAWLVLGAALLMLIGFAEYPVVAAVQRLAGRRGAPAVRAPARILAATGLAAVVGTMGYLLFVLMTGAMVIGPTVAGGPIPWRVVQALTVVTVAATVWTAVAWWRNRHGVAGASRVRLTVLMAAAALFIPWALFWGPLAP